MSAASARRRAFANAICAIALSLLMGSARAEEGDVRWRIVEKDNRVVPAAMEEAATHLPSGYFWCMPRLGLGSAATRFEFEVGLDQVAEFQRLCERPGRDWPTAHK